MPDEKRQADADDITDEEVPFPQEDESRRGVSEVVRRALLAGVGAVFMTEEGIRKAVNDLKLPKEAFSYLVNQADKTRNEATRIVRNEVRRFLNSDAFKQELGRLVSGLTLEIKAEVRLRPNTEDGKTTPEVDGTVRVKSNGNGNGDKAK